MPPTTKGLRQRQGPRSSHLGGGSYEAGRHSSFVAYSLLHSIVSWPLWLGQLWLGPARVSELRTARGLTALGHRRSGPRASCRHDVERSHRGRVDAGQVVDLLVQTIASVAQAAS